MSAEQNKGESFERSANQGPVTDSAAGVRELAEQLRGLAERLRDPELGDAEAAELAREAAETVSEASNRIERALREPAAEDA